MTSTSLHSSSENRFALPCSPTLSSYAAGWHQVQLACFRQPAYRIPAYYSPDHVICINIGSPVRLQQTVDGRSQTNDSVLGEIGIYPANLWQTFHWDQEVEFLQLYLDPMLIKQVGSELCDDDSVELVPQLTSCFDPLIFQIAIALKTVLETDGIGSKLYVDAMANALAVHLLCRYSTHNPSSPPSSGRLSQKQLKTVIDYIHEHLSQDLSLARLATIAQISPYHFARLFKQSTGLAPHQYHIRCRVERAKQLLLNPELSIAEIAQDVGFSSQSHLNYHFKRWVGMTPRTFFQQ